MYVENKTSNKDIIFRVNDGGTFTTIAHVDGADGRFQFVAGKLDIAGTAVTSTAAELNLLDADSTIGSNGAWVGVPRIAKGNYTQDGSNSSVGGDGHDLTLTIPINSFITDVIIDETTNIADDGTNNATLTLSIGGKTIIQNQAIDGNGISDGGVLQSLLCPLKTTNTDVLKLTIANKDLTAGVFDIYITYFTIA